MFKLTGHAVQQYLVRYCKAFSSLINDLSYLQREIEDGNELSPEQIKKIHKPKWIPLDGNYHEGTNTIFIVKDNSVITIWPKGMKRIPKVPKIKS